MASYQLYKYHEFKGIDNRDYKTELWKYSSETLVASSLLGGESPFILSMPDLSNKFDPVRGTGCTIHLISRTNMELIGLYATGMQDIQIRFYQDGVLIWCGYLNSESYEESFSDITNYPITVEGNDGFNLLDRMNYVDDNKEHYTGIKTQWDIIIQMLAKLNLPYHNVYAKLSTTLQSTPGPDTVLHYTFVNQDNYYNEDGDPETYRVVLEGILKPYGAFILQVNGSLFITDINTLLSASNVTFRKYSADGTSYISDESIQVLKDISDIGYMGTGQKLAMIAGINKQTIKFSRYASSTVVDSDDSNTADITPVPITFTLNANGYYNTANLQHKNWQLANNGHFLGSAASSTSTPDYAVRWPADNSGIVPAEYLLAATFVGKTPYIVSNVTDQLKLSMSVLVRLRNNPYNSSENPHETSGKYMFKVRISIGGFYFNPDNVGTSNQPWQTTPCYTDLTVYDTGSDILDQWKSTVDYYIPLEFKKNNVTKQISGNLVVEFFQQWEEVTFKEIWVKDLKVEVADILSGSIIDTGDYEYYGTLNQDFKETGADVSLIHGTAIRCIDKGALLYQLSPGLFSAILFWTKMGISNNIERLLLRSIVSNYDATTIELTGMVLKNSINFLNVLSNLAYLPNSFQIKGADIDFWDNTFTCNLQEISQDTAIIDG